MTSAPVVLLALSGPQAQAWDGLRVGCQRNRVNPIVNGSYILAVAVALSLFASSCGHGSEDTSGPDPIQAATSEGQSKPDLSPATRIEIQVNLTEY